MALMQYGKNKKAPIKSPLKKQKNNNNGVPLRILTLEYECEGGLPSSLFCSSCSLF
jgi:hypothetical protein